MQSSMPGQGPSSAKSSHSDYSFWRFEGGAINLALRLRVVDWLNDEVAQSLRPSTKRAEVGGILLGRIGPGTRPLTIIEGFVPVCSDRMNCPLYHLSAGDKLIMEEQFARWTPGTGKNLYAIGYYRSHNREGLRPDAKDSVLIHEFFPDQAGIFLLIKSAESHGNIGGFFSWEDRRLREESSLLFPFHSGRLRAGEKELESLPRVEVEVSSRCYCATEIPVDRVDSHGQPEHPLYHSLDATNAAKNEQYSSEVHGAAPHTPALEQTWSVSPGEGKLPSSETRKIRLSLDVRDQEIGKPDDPVAVKSPVEAVHGGDVARTAADSVSKKVSWWDELSARISLWPWRLVFSLAIFGAALSGTGYFLWHWFSAPGLEQGSGNARRLDLAVGKEKDRLCVTWNKESPFIRSARRGVLNVTDGSFTKEMALDSNQLNSGSICYSNKTDNVTFRLRVMASDTETTEWVRVVGVNRLKGESAEGRAAIKPYSRGWAGSVPREPARNRERKLAGLRPPQPAGPNIASSPNATLPSEAIFGVAEKSAVQGSSGESAAPRQGEAPDAPIAQSGPGNARSESADETNYEQPRPLRQIDPYVPLDMRPYIPGQIRIKVKVYVNDEGRVTRAERADQESPPPFLSNAALDALSNLALETARQWLFFPARRYGKNVESVVTLEFQFGDVKK